MWVNSWTRRLRRVPWVTLTMMRVLQPGGDDAHQIDAAHLEQSAQQGSKIRVDLLSHGDDVIVHQRLQKQAGLHICHGT